MYMYLVAGRHFQLATPITIYFRRKTGEGNTCGESLK